MCASGDLRLQWGILGEIITRGRLLDAYLCVPEGIRGPGLVKYTNGLFVFIASENLLCVPMGRQLRRLDQIGAHSQSGRW